MLETYAVGVKLEMASNVSGVLDNLIRDVERFNTLVKESGTALGKMATSLRELGGGSSAIPGIEKMAEAMKATETAAAGLNKSLKENAEYASEAARSMQASAKAMEQANRAGRGGGGSSSSHGKRFSEHNIMMAGMGAGIVGGALVAGVRYSMTPAIDVARSRDVLASDMRLTPDQVDAALARSRETTKLAPGTTIGENMAAVVDLKNVFGSLDESLKMLPEFARMSSLFSVLDRKNGGSGDQAFAAAKAMEILGEMITEHVGPDGKTVRGMDPEKGMAHLNMMEQVAVATNMRVAPSDYLGLAKQARVAGMNLSDEFTFQKLPAMMQVMGGSRAGTALMSMAQVFEGGKMTDKSYYALEDIGLASKSGAKMGVDPHTGKRRMIIDSGGIYDLDLLRHDPLAWMQKASERMDAKGIHGSEAQITALMKASQRTTIAGFLADLLKDMPAILKEQQNIQNTRPDMAQHMAAVDPAAKVQQFEAALTNLATELGSAGMGDAMKVLDAATAGLNKLGEWAHNNPNLGRIAFDAGAGLGAVATGLGALSTAILVFGPALRLLGLGGGATAGVSAGRAVAGAVAGSAGVGIPLAVAGVAAAAIYDAATDPHYGEKAKARDLAAGRASAEAAKAAPQSSTFVPADGYGVDGRPITLQGDIVLDKDRVGKFVAKSLSGPTTKGGTTGFDIRSGYYGNMPGQ